MLQTEKQRKKGVWREGKATSEIIGGRKKPHALSRRSERTAVYVVFERLTG